jgi:hypothetical protein
MSEPARLSNKLHENLGHQAAEDLVNWLDAERAARAKLHQGMLAGFAETREEFRTLIAKQTMDLTEKIHMVDLRVSQVESNLMKWSFVFWVGAVAAIAMLAGVLR